MNKLFGENSPVMAFLSKATDLMLLNMMWLVGCLPIVTIGASTTALYRCIRKYKEDDDYPKGLFWKAFKENLKQSTALFLVVALVLAIVTFDLYAVVFSSMDAGVVDIIVFVILALLTIPFSGYVFPLQAQFENSVTQTLKNAWLISIFHLHMSIVIAALNFLPVLLLIVAPNLLFRSLILWFFFGEAVIAYINDAILHGIFNRYYHPKAEAKNEETE